MVKRIGDRIRDRIGVRIVKSGTWSFPLTLIHKPTLEVVSTVNLLIVILVIIRAVSKCSSRPHPPIFAVTETSWRISKNHDKTPDCHPHAEEEHHRAVAGKLSRAGW